VRISPGRLTALWVVLRALHSLGDHGGLEELRRHAARTSLRSGGLPIRDGLTLAVAGTFAVRAGDTLMLSPLGHEALALGKEDEPSVAARRLFLSVLLLREPPPWVAFWQGQPESLELILPEPERHLLADVGLYPEEDSDIENVSWWDALRRVPLPEEAGAYRKLVGDAGEELTVAYERARLRALGQSDLAARVRWVARESPAYGFDVLSYPHSSPSSSRPTNGAPRSASLATTSSTSGMASILARRQGRGPSLRGLCRRRSYRIIYRNPLFAVSTATGTRLRWRSH
jgi:hypothetical protein